MRRTILPEALREVKRFRRASQPEVTVTFVSDFLDPARYDDVRHCSRFPGDQPPACDKACLALGKDAIRAQDLRRQPLPVLPLA